MKNFSSFLLSFWVLLTISCAGKIYPPVAMTERTNTIYPEPRPRNCRITVLTSKPTESYEPFAQIISYAGSAEMTEKMESLIKETACEEGAEAIILFPVRQVDHVNTVETYPDWVVDSDSRQGERFQHWVDKRYSVAQRAIALVRKREPSSVEK
jgi:hypothetical protein